MDVSHFSTWVSVISVCDLVCGFQCVVQPYVGCGDVCGPVSGFECVDYSIDLAI